MVARSAFVAASDAATTTLLNCYLREGGSGVFDGDELVLPGLDVRAEVTPSLGVLPPPLPRPRAARRRAARGAGAGRAAGARRSTRAPPPDALLEPRAREPGRGRDRPRGARGRRRAAVERAARCASRSPSRRCCSGHPLHPTPKGLCGRLRQYTPELQPQLPAALALGRRRHRRPRQRDRHARPGARRAAVRARRAARPDPAPRPPVGGRLPRPRGLGAVHVRRRDRPRPGRRRGHADHVGAHRLPRRSGRTCSSSRCTRA